MLCSLVLLTWYNLKSYEKRNFNWGITYINWSVGISVRIVLIVHCLRRAWLSPWFLLQAPTWILALTSLKDGLWLGNISPINPLFSKLLWVSVFYHSKRKQIRTIGKGHGFRRHKSVVVFINWETCVLKHSIIL